MKRDALPAAAPRTSAHDAAWRTLVRAACEPYRHDASFSGRWAWYWARSKLALDPVFRGLLERGDIPSAPRVVDIGCGLGLVAALLQACAEASAAGRWPQGWPAAPQAGRYAGIELMPRDAARGNAALRRFRARGLQARIECSDLRTATLPDCELVVILDVLHYVDATAQDALLRRVRDALSRGVGARRLLLRVGDTGESAAGRRGAVQTLTQTYTQAVDWLVSRARGQRVATHHVRPLQAWTDTLRALGFSAVQRVPMSQGTPFSNVLLIADLPLAAP